MPILQVRSPGYIDLPPTTDRQALLAASFGRDELALDPLWNGELDREPAPFKLEDLTFYQCDHLGTPQELTDHEGKIAWEAKTRAWGEVKIALSDPSIRTGLEQNIRFQGQYFDEETGLHSNRFRYYEPEQGRYAQSDPIGLGGGINTYAYVGGNPLSQVDTRGLAYFAYRPLAGLSWLGPLSSNPLDDKMHTDIAHEQLIFEDKQSPTNLGFFGDGTVKIDPNPNGYRPIPGRYDDCLMRIAAQYTSRGDYQLVGNNCQSRADRVRDEYKKLLTAPGAQLACHK